MNNEELLSALSDIDNIVKENTIEEPNNNTAEESSTVNPNSGFTIEPINTNFQPEHQTEEEPHSNGDEPIHIEESSNSVETYKIEEVQSSNELPDNLALTYTANTPCLFTTNEESISSTINNIMKDNSINMPYVSWVGNFTHLFNYITDIQDSCGLTVPLSHLGISPDVFKNTSPDNYNKSEDDQFTIFGYSDDPYVLIYIDGEYYISSTAKTYNEEHLTNVCRELITSLLNKGTYTLYRTVPRIFHCEGKNSDEENLSDETRRCFINCLNLNNFEVAVVLEYAKGHIYNDAEISITHTTDKDGKAIIKFDLIK